MGLKAQRMKPVMGLSAIIGETGEIVELLNPSGKVLLNGEIWNAISVSGMMKPGERVRVKEVKNLILYVEPLNA